MRCCRSTPTATWSSGWRPSGPTSPSSPCTAPAARTAPPRSCSRSSASPSPGPASPPARAASTRSRQARAARGGHPDPGLVRLQRDRLPRARRRRRARRARGAARLPARGQAQSRRLGAGGQVRRRTGSTCPRRWSPPSATTTGSCSSASSRGASWRSACSAASRCRWSRRSPASGDGYDFEARYEIGRTSFVCPAELSEARRRRSPRRPWAPTRRLAAPASPAST